MKTCRKCKYFGKQKKTHFYICYNPKSEYFNRLFSHGKMPKACRSYEGKPYIDYDGIEGMKFVESLRNEYPNSDFWIIGTDSNLDLYPDNFFNGKLSITLNGAFLAFLDSTYFCSAATNVAKAIVDKLGSEYLGKCIFATSSQKPRGTENSIWWEDWGLDPVYIKSLRKPRAEQDDEDRERMIRQLSDEGPIELIAGVGIITFAIQVAALFGAKKIILVGCSGKAGDFYWHAQKRGMSEFYRDKEWEPGKLEMYRIGQGGDLIEIKRETIMLVRLFKKHKIEIVRHRFDKEKRKFVFEKIEE